MKVREDFFNTNLALTEVIWFYRLFYFRDSRVMKRRFLKLKHSKAF